jgi:hypothetical protein
MKIRKQFADFTPDDFRRCPLWEFCSDEEDVEGQDETTAKPSEDTEVPGYSPGAYLVAADFVLADGSPLEGFIFSGEPDDFGCVQPNIFIAGQMFAFWFGISPPSAQQLGTMYQRLGKSPEQVFPVSYTTRVPVNGTLLRGTIRGFGETTMRGEMTVFS